MCECVIMLKALRDDELPECLKKLIDPRMQKYIDTPPGVGMGVIYVQISPSKKMYVGQHCHRGEGNSVARNRLDKSKHLGCVVISNAFKKYGADNMRTFIVARCPEGVRDVESAGDTNCVEKFFISTKGLDTIVPNGYNLQYGGKNGKAHADTKNRMSESGIKRWTSMTKERRNAISTNIKESKIVQYNDPIKGEIYRSKLSVATTKNNEDIMNDMDLRTSRREKRTATRKGNQALRDANKWMPRLSAAKDDTEFHKVLEMYKKTLRRREVENNSVARRKGYGSPPLPMTPDEASKIGRKKIAADINEVVAKRKLTQGY